VLVDLNPQRMVNALHVPENKLAKRSLDSAAQRVVTLKELLGPQTPDLELIKIAMIKGFKDVLGIEAEFGEITGREEQLAKEYFDEEIGTDEFLTEIDNPAADEEVLAGTHTGAGGTIDAFVKLEGPTQEILQRVLISGDFFVTPPRVVFDLEAALQGVRLEEVGLAIDRFFSDTDIDTLSVTPADFQASIANALAAGQSDG
jgi:lipoate-protein ligase A